MSRTIPPFDVDAMVAKEPSTWRERGLHFHCYMWRGAGTSLMKDAERRDPASDLPPERTREWLRKPRRLQLATPPDPETATAWLLERFEAAAPDIKGSYPGGDDPGFRRRLALYQLRSGADITWGFWLRGSQFLHLTVLAIAAADCPGHTNA